MARKVRFGLRNSKYAIWDSELGAYGELKAFPWAVSLSLSAEGGDGNDFYATVDDDAELDAVFEKYLEIAEADEDDD